MDNDKTNNIYFPLCCLNFDKDISKTAGLLISYGAVEFAKRIENIFELNFGDEETIDRYIEKYNLSTEYKESDNYIILAAHKLGIIIGSLANTRKQHSEIIKYIRSYEMKYGTDAIVKVHKNLLFEVRDKKFDERMFRVYCAVVSSIGNKPFLRIVVNTIAIRMLGFKSKEVYNNEKSNFKLLTARQIKTTSDKLSDRNFFAMRTYRNRLTFYSTKLRGNEFKEVLENSIALNKAKKEVNRINNVNLNSGVDDKLKQFREKLLSGQSIKEIKSNMELFKAG